uniref:Uncharacterized protein n=1 Tax=Coptotermes formosanus TaxID=36987 RepID=R4V2V8_COPFO|nr:hypothetical protein [Coptotermes formosanus]
MFLILSFLISELRIITNVVQYYSSVISDSETIYFHAENPYTVVVFRKWTDLKVEYNLSSILHGPVEKSGTFSKVPVMFFKDFVNFSITNTANSPRAISYSVVSVEPECQHHLYVTNLPDHIFVPLRKFKYQTKSKYCFFTANSPTLNVFFETKLAKTDNLTFFGFNETTFNGSFEKFIQLNFQYFMLEIGVEELVDRYFTFSYHSGETIDSKLEFSRWVKHSETITLGLDNLHHVIIFGVVVLVFCVVFVFYFAFRKSLKSTTNYQSFKF